MRVVFTVKFATKLIFLKEKFLKLSKFGDSLSEKINQQISTIDNLIFQYIKNTNGGISDYLDNPDTQIYGLVQARNVSFKAAFLNEAKGSNTFYFFNEIVSIIRED